MYLQIFMHGTDDCIRQQLSLDFNEILYNIIPNTIVPQLSEILENKQKTSLHHDCKKIIKTYMDGKFSKQVTDTLMELSYEYSTVVLNEQFHLIKSNFPELIVDVELSCMRLPGRSVQESRILHGIILQRDFMKNPGYVNIKNCRFVLINFALDQVECETETHLTLSSDKKLSVFLNHISKIIEKCVARMQKFHINLLISTAHVSDLVLEHCQHAGIYVVQCCDDDEARRLSRNTNTSQLHTPEEFLTDFNFGSAKKCSNIVIASKKIIHFDAIQPNLRQTSDKACNILPVCILVCGPSESICDQYCALVVNSLKCIHMWLRNDYCNSQNPSDVSWGYSIPACGQFEKYVYWILQLYSTRTSTTPRIKRICDIIGQALLTVPVTLSKNSWHRKQSIAEILSDLKIDMAAQKYHDSDIMEPLNSKVLLLHHVIALIQQLLRVHCIVDVKKITSHENSGECEET